MGYRPLGLLNYMRIWHDNFGRGASASWFLKSIIVRDLKTMQNSHFICQRWLVVEKDDGKVRDLLAYTRTECLSRQIERLLPVAGDYQKQQFAYRLSKEVYHSVSDNHLWLSIFSPPTALRFTRLQRCTCCFVVLFLSMFLNILYCDQAKDQPSTASVSLGPLLITTEQVRSTID